MSIQKNDHIHFEGKGYIKGSVWNKKMYAKQSILKYGRVSYFLTLPSETLLVNSS